MFLLWDQLPGLLFLAESPPYTKGETEFKHDETPVKLHVTSNMLMNLVTSGFIWVIRRNTTLEEKPGDSQRATTTCMGLDESSWRSSQLVLVPQPVVLCLTWPKFYSAPNQLPAYSLSSTSLRSLSIPVSHTASHHPHVTYQKLNLWL